MGRNYGEEYLPLLETALEEEIGIYVETDLKHLLLNILYEQKQKDARFEELTILQPAIEGHPNVLFIAKKTTELVD